MADLSCEPCDCNWAICWLMYDDLHPLLGADEVSRDDSFVYGHYHMLLLKLLHVCDCCSWSKFKPLSCLPCFLSSISSYS
jgi:hypothetical protein